MPEGCASRQPAGGPPLAFLFGGTGPCDEGLATVIACMCMPFLALSLRESCIPSVVSSNKQQVPNGLPFPALYRLVLLGTSKLQKGSKLHIFLIYLKLKMIFYILML